MARSYATSSIVEAGLDDVTDKYRGTGEYFLVFDELFAAAKHRGTVT